MGHKQITEFGDPSVDWDRHWTAVAFSIPETDRDIREAFRARLKWLGFAPVYGALWFSPRDRVAQVTETAEGYGVDDFMAFRLEDTALQGRRPAVIYSQDLPERYAAFAQKNESRLERLRQPGADPREAFRMRIETMDEWRAFPWDDAGMPYELLPADWPLRPARSTFIDVYRATAEGALQYIHGVLTESAPEAIPGIRLPEIP
jgi:phenylacetic acid degradation operon negative regulatory protein